EARVEIEAQPAQYDLLKAYGQDLPAFFIVSDVVLHLLPDVPESPGFIITVDKATGIKCERCWNYRSAVGTFPDHPTLCDRCVEAVR
ncbi:MAG: zinc finger domain-containing protein, partial [Nitrospira sp.]